MLMISHKMSHSAVDKSLPMRRVDNRPSVGHASRWVVGETDSRRRDSERVVWTRSVSRTRRGLPQSSRTRWSASRVAAVGRAVLVALCLATPVLGQTVEGTSSEERRVSFTPTLSVADVGWDDNVFRVNKSDRPIGDFTATFTPAAQVALRTSRLRLTSEGRVDFIYFKELADVRSIDSNASGRVEVLLGRITPYVGGGWTSARHRRNFEIDSPVRRVEVAADAGIDVQISGKTSTGVMTRWSKVDYEGDTIYLDTDLAFYLASTTVSNGVRFRYALTPLTTIAAEAQLDRTEFASARERNSTGSRVTSVIELRPFALISGRAQVGFRTRTFEDGSVSPFRGAVARADVVYTLLGRTQMAVSVQRDLAYSYRADQRDYLQTGTALSITHRIAGAWDVGGSVGRFRLTYGLGDDPGSQISIAERVLTYGVNLGYLLDRTRMGFQVARQRRSSGFSANREYEDMRIGSTVTYAF